MEGQSRTVDDCSRCFPRHTSSIFSSLLLFSLYKATLPLFFSSLLLFSLYKAKRLKMGIFILNLIFLNFICYYYF